MARIYKASHTKMVSAMQNLKDVNKGHPDKVCEFGRNTGIPLLLENVNAVNAARGEKCFGQADQQRLASFRKLLDDEQRAVAIDCKRAFDAEVASNEPSQPPSGQAATPAVSHPAPSVPHIGQAVSPPTSTGQGTQASAQQDCSDLTGVGGGPGPINCNSNKDLPPNVQAQINQAKSYMQAAQTVKRSDPSYSGRSTAAQQFRRAAAAFQALGDFADAANAVAQAQALENGLKTAGQGSAPTNASAPSAMDRLRFCASGKTCAAGEACLEWSTPGEGSHEDCRPLNPPQSECAQKANIYNPSDGQNKALMSAACLYYCFAKNAASGQAEFYKLYEISQQRAKNMCSMGAGTDCNAIDTGQCQ
jgi:hypothetical protein